MATHTEINNRRILNHGWVNFPLAYTQVSTLNKARLFSLVQVKVLRFFWLEKDPLTLRFFDSDCSDTLMKIYWQNLQRLSSW